MSTKFRSYRLVVATLTGVLLLPVAGTAQVQLGGGGGIGGTGVGPSVGPNIGPNIGPGVRQTVPLRGQSRLGGQRGLPGQQPLQRAVPGARQTLQGAIGAPQQTFGPTPIQLGDLGTGTTLGQQGNLGLTVDGRQGRVRVGQIESDSFAANAGLQVGDEILATSGQWVRSPEDLTSQLQAAAQADGMGWVYISRNGQNEWIRLDFGGAGAQQGKLGVNLNDSDGTVRLTHISDGSAAADAGLQVGDEVLAINGNAVQASAHVVSAVQAAAQSDGEVVLNIRRDGVEQTIRSTVGTVDSLAQDATGAARHTAGRAITEVHQQAAALNDRLAQIEQQLNQVKENATDTVATQVERIETSLNNLRSQIDGVAQETGELAEGRIDQIRTSVDSLRSEIDQAAQQADGETRAALQATSEAVSQMEANVQAMAEAGVAATADLSAQLGETADATAEFATQASAQLMAETQASLEGISGGIRQLANHADETVRNNAEQLRADLDRLQRDVRQTAASEVQDARQFANSTLERVEAMKQNLDQLARETTGDARRQLDEARQELDSLVDNLRQHARGTAGEAREAADDLRGDVRGALEEARGTAGEAIESARGAFDDARGALRDTGEEGRDAIDDARGEARP